MLIVLAAYSTPSQTQSKWSAKKKKKKWSANPSWIVKRRKNTDRKEESIWY